MFNGITSLTLNLILNEMLFHQLTNYKIKIVRTRINYHIVKQHFIFRIIYEYFFLFFLMVEQPWWPAETMLVLLPP